MADRGKAADREKAGPTKLGQQQALNRGGIFGRIVREAEPVRARPPAPKVEAVTTADVFKPTPRPKRKARPVAQKRGRATREAAADVAQGNLTKPLSMRWPPDLLAAVDAEAEARGLSRAATIIDLLREALK